MTQAHIDQQQLSDLRHNLDHSAKVICDLLSRHGRRLDHEMADFIRCYLDSLQLDFELAMTRGEARQLEFIVEDVEALLMSTELKIRKRRVS